MTGGAILLDLPGIERLRKIKMVSTSSATQWKVGGIGMAPGTGSNIKTAFTYTLNFTVGDERRRSQIDSWPLVEAWPNSDPYAMKRCKDVCSIR